jgi:hypothetical protein
MAEPRIINCGFLGTHGRLCNQILRIGLGLRMADDSQCEVRFHTEWEGRDYFNLQLNRIQERFPVKNWSHLFLSELDYENTYPETRLPPNTDVIGEGIATGAQIGRELFNKHFQFHKSIDAQFRNRLRSLNPDNKKVICIHLRHGDFKPLTDPAAIHFITTPISWIAEFLSGILDKNTVIYICSDDLDKSRKTLNYFSQYIINLTEESHYFDLFMLSMCDTGILSLSTYSFVGAFLNKRNATFFIPDFDRKHFVSKDLWETFYYHLPQRNKAADQQKNRPSFKNFLLKTCSLLPGFINLKNRFQCNREHVAEIAEAFESEPLETLKGLPLKHEFSDNSKSAAIHQILRTLYRKKQFEEISYYSDSFIVNYNHDARSTHYFLYRTFRKLGYLERANQEFSLMFRI